MYGEDIREANQREELALPQAAKILGEEARMILPGIQALFGFQMIAVYHDAFRTLLTPGEQYLHLLSVCLNAVAIALVMTPAALHRQADPRGVSVIYLRTSSRLLLGAMFALAPSISIGVYLVARVIAGTVVAVLIVIGVALVFIAYWLVMPEIRRVQIDRLPKKTARPSEDRMQVMS